MHESLKVKNRTVEVISFALTWMICLNQAHGQIKDQLR